MERLRWDIYRKEMSQLGLGHALWEPAPHSYFKRIQPGDVGYIREGCFHLLFSASCPSGEKEFPPNFKELEVGQIFNRQSREPGYLATKSVRATRVIPPPRIPPSLPSPVPCIHSVTPVSSVNLDACSRMGSTSFQLSGGQGAAILTKYQTLSEDIQRTGTFEKYIKKHYTSWVAFASATGHGDDINPVLVTGVDRTKDFAMMTYSSDDDNDDLGSEFITWVPGDSAFAWGTWHTTGFVYRNCGPQLHFSHSSAQTIDSTTSGNNNAEPVSDEYNQCIFIRYYTMRKRLGIPKVIKAGAGPHDLGPGFHEDEGSSKVEARSPSDSGSDSMSILCDDDGGNDRSSATSIEYESDVVVHTTPPDEKDDFDAVADYVFRNSDADSILIHHRDIALLHEPGDGTDLSTQLLEKRPAIVVDENGVGKIVRESQRSTNTSSYYPLGITQPIPLFTPSETEHVAMDEMALPESQPLSRLDRPRQSVSPRTREVTAIAGSSVTECTSYPPAGESFEDSSPQIVTPVDDDAGLRATCSVTTSLLPPIHSSQMAPYYPPNWRRIPQNVYDYGWKQLDFRPSDPILFRVNGYPGVNMGDALRKIFTGLDGRDDLILQDAQDVISCRLWFPGYPRNSSTQIFTKRWNKSRDPIKRSTLAYYVARKLKHYLDSMASSHSIDGSTDGQWKIGEGFMQLDNMFMVQLKSVSRSSYQPDIWVVDRTM